MFRFIIIIFICLGCSGRYYKPESMSLNCHTGKDTKLISTGLGPNDHMSVGGIDISVSRKENFIRYGIETSFTEHRYNDSFEGNMIDSELFLQLEKMFADGWFVYVGGGAGIGKFIETEGYHDLIYQDELIGVIDFRTGIRKEYEFVFLCIQYKLDHYSGFPPGDKGINDDAISIEFGINF